MPDTPMRRPDLSLTGDMITETSIGVPPFAIRNASKRSIRSLRRIFSRVFKESLWWSGKNSILMRFPIASSGV